MVAATGHDEGVPILDVCEFMGDDPSEFPPVQRPQQPHSNRHGRMLRASPGRKRIGSVLGNHVNLGLWKIASDGQLSNDRVERRRLVLVHFLSSVHTQHYLVRKPVRAEIQQDRYNRRNHQAGVSAQRLPGPQEQRRHRSTSLSDSYGYNSTSCHTCWDRRVGRLVEVGKWTLSPWHATGQHPLVGECVRRVSVRQMGNGPRNAAPDSWVEATTTLAHLQQKLTEYGRPFARAERVFLSLGAHGITLLLLTALLLGVIFLE